MRVPLLSTRHTSPWWWLAFGLAAVLVRGLFLDVMDVDASQYASISMEMEQHDSWLQVLHRGADYLDKPPLLFWFSAASFRLFGFSNWAYKLPSLLAALLGVYGVFRFTKLFYTVQTARHAAFILAASAGFIVLCNDVRTDTLLLGTTTCAVWQLAEYMQFKRWSNLLWAFCCLALAMLSKGPIGLVMPGLALGTHLLLRRDWRNLFRWQWLAGLCVTALLLMPMCWGLYQQFDLHPEKTVNDRSGVSGLYFFFWEQSFGRITGENVWKNDTTSLYFLHVYLWCFLPWPLLMVGALWQRLRQLGAWLRVPDREEAYSLGGFVLTFVALSLSKYKLPHYIFITLPWASVLAARYIHVIFTEKPDRWRIRLAFGTQYLVGLIMLTAAFLLVGYVFFSPNLFVWSIPAIGTIWLLLRILRNPAPPDADVFVQRSVLMALVVMLVVNFHFYPNLLPYQSGATAAKWAHEHGIPAKKLAFFNRHSHTLDFYNRYITEKLASVEQVKVRASEQGDYWIYTNETGKTQLDTAGVRYETTARFDHFQAALLKTSFLNPATRPTSLDHVFLLKILKSENR